MSQTTVTIVIDDETGEVIGTTYEGKTQVTFHPHSEGTYLMTLQLRDTERVPALPPAENISEALQTFASTLVVLPEGTKVIDGDDDVRADDFNFEGEDESFPDEDEDNAKTQVNASRAPFPEPQGEGMGVEAARHEAELLSPPPPSTASLAVPQDPIIEEMPESEEVRHVGDLENPTSYIMSDGKSGELLSSTEIIGAFKDSDTEVTVTAPDADGHSE